MQQLVRRAENAGYKAIAVTVDAPRLGRREADVRNRFASWIYECSFSSSPVSEFWTGHIVLQSGLFVVPCVCVPRFTLPENVVLKCFEGLDLSKMDKVYLKTELWSSYTASKLRWIYSIFYFILFLFSHQLFCDIWFSRLRVQALLLTPLARLTALFLGR